MSIKILIAVKRKKVVLTIPKINGGGNTFDNAYTYESEPNFMWLNIKWVKINVEMKLFCPL